MVNREIQMIGNAALLELPGKVAFLSSRRVTPAAVMRCYGARACDGGLIFNMNLNFPRSSRTSARNCGKICAVASQVPTINY